MVGKFLGIPALGLYGLAYNYSLLPIMFLGISLGNVVFAELPRLYSDPPRFWSAFFTSSKLLAGLVCPLAAVLALIAPDVFPVLFGPQWASAVAPFQILAIYGAIRGIWMEPFCALGKFRAFFWMGLATFLLAALAIYVALPYGKIGVAIAVLITVGPAHIASLYIASGSLTIWVRGLRNSAPYFLTAAAAALLAIVHSPRICLGDHRQPGSAGAGFLHHGICDLRRHVLQRVARIYRAVYAQAPGPGERASLMPPFTLIPTPSKMPQGAEAGSMPPAPQRPASQRWIALLGRSTGAGADGVEDYCAQLRDAFLEKGVPFEMLRMPLAEQSWRSSLAWLRGRLAAHDPAVVLLQYNALSWSRRGFSVGALLVLRTLKRHTSRVGVIFHDAGPYPGTRLRDRIRRRVQIWVMRRLIKNSAKSICALPADCLPWFPAAAIKNKFSLIPIGSGMSQISAVAAPAAMPATKNDLRIAVFGVGLNNVAGLSAQLARIVSAAAQGAGPVRLAVFGLGARESESALRKNLEGTPVTLEIDGVLGATEVCERLRQSSVQLFIRSGVSACRSSVVAGICCGLPIVGWQDWDTAYPVTEAGLRTAPRGDEAGLIRELASVLTDGALRSQLSLKSAEAADKLFFLGENRRTVPILALCNRPQRFAQRPIFVDPRIIHARIRSGGNIPCRPISAAIVQQPSADASRCRGNSVRPFSQLE